MGMSTLFLSGSASNLAAKYAIVFENAGLIEAALGEGKGIALSEEESGHLRQRIEDYLEEAKEFIEKSRAAGGAKISESKTWTYISLGMSLLGLLLLGTTAIPMAVATANALSVAAMIIALLAFVPIVVGVVRADQAVKEAAKLRDQARKLRVMKERTENKELRAKIEEAILKAEQGADAIEKGQDPTKV